MTDLAGLVFDKDGTLFDFNATWGAWTRRMLVRESNGDPGMAHRLAEALGFDAATERFRPGSVVIAEPVHTVADRIMAITGATDRAALIARMNAQAAEVPQRPAADLPRLLDHLRARGLTLGLATNDAEAPARAHLQAEGITDRFDFIAGADSGHGHKPGPGQLLAFLDRTGLAPGACAMIGDSTHDLEAGRAAGMVCVGVLTGPAPRAELTPMADVVLDTIADLFDWLDARTG
ncbi:HAD family hydrolase [Salipiger sp. IMCC34102]|uniref:HAD family hydrolase n=1 Tax=Salipiger sp. IMCC34102 TaxID=2510647 RepID=UPI00101CCD2C|nr:HAD family hydrolase [Salipiger sp. IMCC34102]RYH01928.1 HAD family hydrolase [Salipiger sp. IMCC34102]